MKSALTVLLFAGFLGLITESRALAETRFGGRLGLIMPRDGQIKYADLAPSATIFLRPSLDHFSRLHLNFEISTAFFQENYHNFRSNDESAVGNLREYGYSLHAGLSYAPVKRYSFKRRLIPTFALIPGFYLMNSELQLQEVPVNNTPAYEHQWKPHFGLRVGLELGYLKKYDSGPILSLTYDYIPGFDRGEVISVLDNESEPAHYWTVALGWSFSIRKNPEPIPVEVDPILLDD